jgi:hypothetical protein
MGEIVLLLCHTNPTAQVLSCHYSYLIQGYCFKIIMIARGFVQLTGLIRFSGFLIVICCVVVGEVG